MKISSRHSGGFSLIEVVIVLFLTGALLAAVGALTRRTLESLTYLREKAETMQSATLVCERLVSEMREMIAPPTGLGSSTFRFVKVNPNAPEALNNDYTDQLTTPPDTWARNYAAANMTTTITYRENLPRVTRQVDSGPEVLVATQVNTFRVTNTPGPTPGTYDITLAIQEKKRVVTFTARVFCPGIPRP